MAVKDIVKVWDSGDILSDNIDFLKNKTIPVKFPVSDSINEIIADLKDTYKEIPCAGIAANQIGYDKSIFIGLSKYTDDMDEDKIEENEAKHGAVESKVNEYADNYEIYINPRIDSTNEKSLQEEIEGCLSIPGISLRIIRYNKIKVRYYREDGTVVKKPMNGFMSKLFQHELDHLNGVLMFQNEVLEGFALKDSNVTPDLYNHLLTKIDGNS